MTNFPLYLASAKSFQLVGAAVIVVVLYAMTVGIMRVPV